MTAYRLTLYGVAPGGREPLSHVYGDVNDACTAAEVIFGALASRPHRMPNRIVVEDVWTRDTVTTLYPDLPRDPDVCPACHAPDPFTERGE